MASTVKHVGDFDEEVRSFLQNHPSLKYNKETKKIKCDLSGHDIPCKLDALKSYTGGKKYQKLRKHEEFDFEKYQPHIIQSNKKSHEHQLFCRLTLRHLNKIPSHVEKHVNGRRYTKALEKYEECQRLGIRYVPASRRKRNTGFGGLESEGEEKKFSTNPEESGEESEAESVDSFSDLYPAGDFDMEEDEGDEEKHDEDVENMDVDSPNAAAGDSKSTRRKGRKDQRKRQLEDDDGGGGGDGDEDADNSKINTNAGKKFKKGKPNKWKGKQKQQKQNNKTDQSKARTGKGKKKQPRIM